MSYKRIRDPIEELYGVKLFHWILNWISGRIIPGIREWQSRSLNKLYKFWYKKSWRHF
ncbi:MAG: hypothetical protein KFF73_00195 [Cyclobacteriaceae bacterium]|nr:hypothetical protein [Cyclobacteriaceae bacterium]